MLEALPFVFRTTVVIYLLLFKVDEERRVAYFQNPAVACAAYALTDKPEMFEVRYSIPLSMDEDRGDVNISQVRCGGTNE